MPADKDRKPGDRLGNKELLGFAVGGLPLNLGVESLKQLAYPVYNIILGVNPAAIGLILMIARLIDAFLDPLIGWLSDNSRSRWGRRRPYVALGSVLCGLTFPLVWFVPADTTETHAIAYFAATAFLYYLAVSVYQVSYMTLGMELTPDYAERTRVMASRTVFGATSGLILAWVFRIAQADMFSDPLTGMRVVGMVLGGIFIATGVPAALASRERYHKLAETQEKQPVLRSLTGAFRYSSFRILMVLTLVIVFCTQSVNALGVYVTTYYVYGGDIKAAATMTAWYGTVTLFATWAALPILTWAARRWGKTRALAVTMAVGCLGAILKWFLFQPEFPYAQLVVACFVAPANAGFWVLVNAMKADMCDWDELKTGLRREGMFAAVSAWLQKLAAAMTFSFAGFVLVCTGFDQAKGGAQASDTLLHIRIVFAFVPAAAYILGIAMLRWYPLSPTVMTEVRAELEAKRAAV
ncbi:MFS transporter [Sphingomonas sp.]|uniref:MFS transporter n=1 Tax=Sphingomonas sp. TaxID=28214 RepID=UPI0025D549B7|nr:MFS transporter [Sphingomonas sp.]